MVMTMWDSQIPVLLFDSSSRRICGVNRAAAALFMCDPPRLEGQLIESCVVREERARLRASLHTFDPRWGDVGSWQCLARDGTRFIAQLRYHQAVHNGELVHVVLATSVQKLCGPRSASAGYLNQYVKCS
jgi:hypothetical protein